MKELIVLNVRYNPNITNINHLTKLRDLYADSVDYRPMICGIEQDGISELRNLVTLTASGNLKITNINHLTKLHPYCYKKINDAIARNKNADAV